MRPAPSLIACLTFAWLAIGLAVAAAAQEPLGIDPAKLAGVVVDESAAKLSGEWKPSQSVRPFVGKHYLHASGDGSAEFTLSVPAAGDYQVLASYTPHANRAASAAFKIRSAGGDKTVIVDQRQTPAGYYCFHPLGEYFFEAGEAVVTVGRTEGVGGAVVVDAVQLLTNEEYTLARSKKDEPPPLFAGGAAASPPVMEAAPTFERKAPPKNFERLTSSRLDALLSKARGMEQFEPHADIALASDEEFLKRATLDLIGRQPTPEEIANLVNDAGPAKREAAIDRLLASPACGTNWANYYSDVISYRTPEPELTFLNYQPFKKWLAEQFNRRRPWDETVYRLLTASGKVGERPEATFIGFHQADRSRLTAETTRIFLGVQTQCAECHDHPFVDMPQKTFHSLAAFFVRAEAKLPWNDSSGIEVKSKDKGEHQMPGGNEMMPAAFSEALVELGAGDLPRRAELAQWLVAPDNAWFAKAFVNRIWARMMGRGFVRAVDEIGPDALVETPAVFDAVAGHFVATGYDLHELLRLIAGSAAYQNKPAAATGPLRGDEIYDSLAAAIELANFTPPAVAATDAARFPPPPKSTRDLVNEAFGYDPSLSVEYLTKSMPQAMFLMNNEQVQRHVSADSASGSLLSRWLDEVSDNGLLVSKLYRQVLGRSPTGEERRIALDHVAHLADRGAAFEDLLWCLINSAEFTTRR